MEERLGSKRLQAAAQFVKKNDRLADIGSDHAYLPCFLVENGTISFAVAGEVAEGPFRRSKTEVERRELGAYIDVRKGNGLDVIHFEDQVTAVSICGMGGRLIASILEEASKKDQLKTVETLILQPNRDEALLRKWLDHNHFSVSDETIVEENKKLYEIIYAIKNIGKTDPAYTDIEYTYGVHLSKICSELYLKKWNHERIKREAIYSKLENSAKENTNKKNTLLKEIAEIKEMIALCQK